MPKIGRVMGVVLQQHLEGYRCLKTTGTKYMNVQYCILNSHAEKDKPLFLL